MDNLAHTLVGAALGRAIADRHVPRAAIIGAVAANMPDIAEVFTGYLGWSRPDFLLHHRGITHSLAGAGVEIVALVLIVGFLVRPAPWRWVALLVAVTLLSHLFMDWQGSYGWRPFLPWNATWYYLDWVAIADPFFWLVPLVALAWGANRHWRPLLATLLGGSIIALVIIRYRDNGGSVSPWVLPLCGAIAVVAIIGWIRFWFGPVLRQRLAMCAVAILALYTIAQGIAVQPRKDVVRQEAVRRFGPVATWAALTNVGRPFTWDPMYASPDTVVGDGWQVPRNLRARAVTQALQTADGHAIGQFARFLTARVDTTVVYLWDSRYSNGGRGSWTAVQIRMESLR
ncbi:MAG TPA: metal-dependent hydrolase [Gemmatimonadales bacterium]|jgi:membrane-bound metal-dependent hydrolase YbcI (DUF457 family)|nr:metal-dependent hydrolase [Gemmatimonadales bacterium]